jgi:GNAT superfamily N-acetyltransferase
MANRKAGKRARPIGRSGPVSSTATASAPDRLPAIGSEVALSRLRAAVLSRLPPRLRRQLKRARDRAQRAESKLRGRLPPALGGRFAVAAVRSRCLTPDDIEAWQRLRPYVGAQRAQPDVLLADEQRFAMGVWLRGRLVAGGLCSIAHGDPSASAPYALFSADFVHPSFRRRGLAQRLHAARLGELTRRGVPLAYAWVDPINLASLAAFAASGFTRVAIEEAPAQLPRSEHELLLRAELNALRPGNP